MGNGGSVGSGHAAGAPAVTEGAAAVPLGEPCGDREADAAALPLRDAGKDGVSEGEELTEELALEVVL